LNLQAFDNHYIQQLAAGDAGVERHFISYFGTLMNLKLRVRLRAADLIEDVKQETFLRVLQVLRQKGGVRSPERFGAFVNSTCNHVLLEICRIHDRYNSERVETDEPLDPAPEPDDRLIHADLQRAIVQVLAELPERDRTILRAIYLEEVNKDAVCRRYGVSHAYLRVLIHRAKSSFREAYLALDRKQPIN
jgi:RNA polymerase sigma-70 factor (ECF subfamily)